MPRHTDSMMLRLPFLFAAFAIACAVSAQPARDGVVDPRFGANGYVSLRAGAQAEADLNGVFDVVRQPEGKLLLVGDGFAAASSRVLPAVARLLPNGALDTTFAGDGVFVLPASYF